MDPAAPAATSPETKPIDILILEMRDDESNWTLSPICQERQPFYEPPNWRARKAQKFVVVETDERFVILVGDFDFSEHSQILPSAASAHAGQTFSETQIRGGGVIQFGKATPLYSIAIGGSSLSFGTWERFKDEGRRQTALEEILKIVRVGLGVDEHQVSIEWQPGLSRGLFG